MNDRQLEKMTIKQLRELGASVDEAIAEKQRTEKAEVKVRIAALAADSGFSLSELIDGRKGRKGAALAVKYRDPKNPHNTWAGRGRKPNWLADAKDIEKFRV